ncbi:MAG TPA: trehalose-phosphatase [Actinomycetota bacterium]|nr:trehalose-phosphatase [Actinomycetota bacterium]
MIDLAAVRERRAEAVVLLDFDGTLAPIVERPEDARPVSGASAALAALVGRVASVWIVTGRPSEVVRRLLGPVDGLRIAGLYGFEGLPPVPPAVVEEVARAADAIDGTQVEAKGASVAVHYRNTADPDGAAAALLPVLDAVATRAGFRVLAGKRVWELAPAGAGGKGEAVSAILDDAEPAAALYAGDDVADLEAFDALDRYAGRRGDSVLVRKVAVLGDETPVALREAADVVVEGPAGVVELLRTL